jgi:hypothetical protein
MLSAALRRFLTLLAATAALTFLCSAAAGLLLGGSFERAVSIGFYLVGCLLLIISFFVGNRGPVRPKGLGPTLFGSRYMRWATPLEREESINESALYFAVGFFLIVLGLAADTRYKLI